MNGAAKVRGPSAGGAGLPVPEGERARNPAANGEPAITHSYMGGNRSGRRWKTPPATFVAFWPLKTAHDGLRKQA